MSERAAVETGAEPAQKFGTFLGRLHAQRADDPRPDHVPALRLGRRQRRAAADPADRACWPARVTFITALSASALATNMRVGVGGEYFMVARSLGLELGGMIGIPLFLCRTLSITFYSYGLAEAILWLWPPAWGEPPAYAVPAIAAVTVVADHGDRGQERRTRSQAPDPDHDRGRGLARGARDAGSSPAACGPPSPSPPTARRPGGSGTSSRSSSPRSPASPPASDSAAT